MEVEYSGSSTFQNCRDTGWKEAPSPQSEYAAFLNNYTQPDCGTGYYRAQVAGRFWSISQSRWITSQWHYTSPIWIVCTISSCQAPTRQQARPAAQ